VSDRAEKREGAGRSLETPLSAISNSNWNSEPKHRESVSGKTIAAIAVPGSPRNWIAVNNSTDIGFNATQQPKEIICDDQK
jgi:hypothetical protein